MNSKRVYSPPQITEKLSDLSGNVRVDKFRFRDSVTLSPTQTFLGLSRVPPHERLPNGPVTFVR